MIKTSGKKNSTTGYSENGCQKKSILPAEHHPDGDFYYIFPTVAWHPSPERGFTAPLTLHAGADHCVFGWGSSNFTHTHTHTNAG